MMKRLLRTSLKLSGARWLIASGVIFALAAPVPAQALLWDWSYTGIGVNAIGTFTTGDAPVIDGFYQITGITGLRNEIAITGLQPAGTSIPGNDGFPVDNLVSASGQLTGDGFGFEMVDNTYSNPFFANFLATPGFLEVFTQEPFTGYTETPIAFSAVIVPEPGTAALVVTALIGLAAMGRRRTWHSGATIALPAAVLGFRTAVH